MKPYKNHHIWYNFFWIVGGLLAALALSQKEASPHSNDPSPNWAEERIELPLALESMTGFKASPVIVAVIDTGIDPGNAIIKPRLWQNATDPGVYGWDFLTNRPNPSDQNGHGTHVASLIARVAPKALLMPLKYYSEKSSGKDNLSREIQAINYAVDHGVNIINISCGGAVFSKEERIALKRAEDRSILVVVAAGNDHKDSDIPFNYYFPAADSLSNMIVVAATNYEDALSSYSNWGKVKVDIAAPGEDISGDVPGNKHKYLSGTSQATAFVSGAAALVLSKNVRLRPALVKEILMQTGTHVRALERMIRSSSRLNVYDALDAVP